MASSDSEDGGLDLDLTDALVPSTSKRTLAPAVDDDDDEDAFILASKSTLPPQRSKRNGKAPSANSKTDKPGGTFQSLGLDAALLRALSLRGFHTPTPIQRASLPHTLASPPRDVVGMARTGSGKTLAYLVPLIQRLGGRHSPKFGVRGLVLVPTRELALQVLKVGKDLAKGYVQGGGTKGKDGGDKEEGLRWGLIVGGDSLDEQFSMIASNPDVIIATPGRLLHLAVEMNLSLRSVLYIVFDEADRLFDLGFSIQLHDILSRLPPNRQTVLFSATLPKSLVDFAKAGLQDPKLVRLDNEVKISEDLEMAFFEVRPGEKEAALLILLHDVIGVPRSVSSRPDDEHSGLDARKRKRKEGDLAPYSTIIFTATKHHVEYLSLLLTGAGYAVSQIYSSLDAAARAIQLSRFRTGSTSVLVVTDLAARGIDVPLLGHVVNYDQPRSEKAFVHRVGRTARNGRKGNAWSLVTTSELAYLMDLGSFLGRIVVPASAAAPSAEELVVGRFERGRLDDEVEHVREALVERDAGLKQLVGVVKRAQGMYERSTAKASSAGHKKVRSAFDGHKVGLHPIFAAKKVDGQGGKAERDELVALVEGFRPVETVFEVASKKGKKKASVAAQIMKDRRRTMDKVVKKAKAKAPIADEGSEEASDSSEVDEEPVVKKDFKDPDLYLGYEQADAATERGYAVRDPTSSFAQQANSATFDLGATDDASFDPSGQVSRPSQLRWDRKTKKFVRGDQGGRDNKKVIRTESGAKLPASFKSGAFEEWKSKSRTRLPRIGEEEIKGRQAPDGRKFRHQAGAPREEREQGKGEGGKAGKKRVFGKTDEGKRKFLGPTHQVTRGGGTKGSKSKSSSSGGAGGGGGKGKAGLKTAHEIRKERELKERRRKRSNQPSRKGR